MKIEKTISYEAIIIGGGLAGLSLAILLAKADRDVLLIEKGDYPRHKVCGEYISNESWDFIKRLGLDLDELNLPQINKLKISSHSGQELESNLDLGGFGISRYVLEENLFELAKRVGVEVLTNTKFVSHKKVDYIFEVDTSKGIFKSEILCASFGKYAPNGMYKKNEEKQNWVGVKYHIKHKHPNDKIVLHNFEGGYCGMSKIENDKSCLCYLVSQEQLSKAGNSIEKLEQTVLRKNRHLDKIFNEAEFLFKKPIVISNITFDVKKPVWNSVFYLGDSAGTIAPLSGNGMSNAFRSAHLLNKTLNFYFEGKNTMKQSLAKYEKDWNDAFLKRIKSGRLLQSFFCKKILNVASITILKYAKSIHKQIIKKTHGAPF